MTVCHVVIIVQEWFTDFELMRLIQTAEMLKPSTPSSGHDSAIPHEDQAEYYPHIIFLQNKAGTEELSVGMIRQMDRTLNTLFLNSNLKCRNTVSASKDNIIPALNGTGRELKMNLFLLPDMNTQSSVSDYRGHPSMNYLIKSLRNQILSVPRSQLTHAALSERNWFHYAARMWDAVKKSTLMSEYNRLLP